MLASSHQYPIVMENPAKPIPQKEPGLLIPILSPKYGCSISIRFLLCGILYHMGNARVFPSISHSIGKCSKSHPMGNTWQIDTRSFTKVQELLFPQIPMLWHTSSQEKCILRAINVPQHGKMQQTHTSGRTQEMNTHTFSKVWVDFFHQIPILWFASSHGECIGLLINTSQLWTRHQNPPYRKDLENQYLYFSQSMGGSPPLIPILWLASSQGKYVGLPINIPQDGKRQQNPSYGKSLGNWYEQFSQSMGVFFPSDSYPMVCFISWKTHECSHQYTIEWENETNPPILEDLGNRYHFSEIMGGSLPSDSHLMVCFIPREMHRSSHQYPIALEKSTKPILLEESGNQHPYFHKVWLVFFHQIPICGSMGNA